MDSDDEVVHEIIENINNNLQHLINYVNKIEKEKKVLKEELIEIKQHINNFFKKE